jgi:putative ABC transport system permease protein
MTPRFKRRDGLDDEIRTHLEMAVRDRMERGETRAEAEAAARREFGNVVVVKEVTRDLDGRVWLARLAQDLRYAARLLRRSPGFTLVAIVSLALGIGAATAIFQIVDAVRLRSLPVERPSELARIRIADMRGARGNRNSPYRPVNNRVFEQIRREQQGFTDVAAWGASGFNLAEGGETRPARGLIVSGTFFDLLGIRPALGRLIADADDRRGCEPRVVLSHAFWQREFGGDRAVVGRTLSLDAHAAEIIGVAPAGFTGLDVGRGFDVAVPICATPMIQGVNRLDSATEWWLVVIGRLKAGWTFERATAQLQAVSPGIFEATITPNYPAASAATYKAFKLEAIPGEAGDSNLRDAYEAPLLMLLAIAGIVLLIACANLANLLLARASARQREIGVRLSLGASRVRVVRQLFTESALLAALGVAGGVLLSSLMSDTLVSLIATTNDAVVLALRTDWRALAFASALGIVTCVLFGLAPALRATRDGTAAPLKIAGRGVVGIDRSGLRRALVVAQVALSLVLVAGGILFARSLSNLRHFDTGFRRDGILVASVDFRRLQLPPEKRIQARHEVLDRIRTAAGITNAAHAMNTPFGGSTSGNDGWLEGTTTEINTNINHVSPGYFQTFGIPLLSGRDFNDRDTASSTPVAIVNETFAERVTGGVNPVGRRFRVQATPNTPEITYEIVGLVRNSTYFHLREDPYPLLVLAADQSALSSNTVRIVIHSQSSLTTTAAGVTRVMKDMDPRIAVTFRVLARQIDDFVVRERLLAMLSIFFASIAALLALLGLYGVIAYGVARRTNEIGVRMALGASRGDVLSMILREAAVLIGVGVVAGLLIALGAGRLAQTLLFGITPYEPVTLATATAVLITLGLMASYWPARAATRIEPTVALRVE